MTDTARHARTWSSNGPWSEVEVGLDVPNLGRAVGFYCNLFEVSPSGAERRTVWFDVPGSKLRIELKEALTPTPTRLRLCTEPHRLQAVVARLRQGGVAVVQAGLTREGTPRAVSFRDPGRNRWELYASILAPPPPIPSDRDTGHGRDSLTERARVAISAAARAVSDAGLIEARFEHEQSRAQTLVSRHGSQTEINRWSS